MNKFVDITKVLPNCSYAIDIKNNSEILIDFPIKINEKNMELYVDSKYKISKKTLGTFLSDFLNTDFNNYDDFSEFVVDYGQLIIDTNTLNKDYKINFEVINFVRDFITQVQEKNKKKCMQLQKEVDIILDYCLFNPTKDAANFEPIKRMYVLKRISPALTILNENYFENYKTILFSSSPGDTEKEIYNFLSNKRNKVEELDLLVPKNLSQILHHSILAVLKNNVHLKICKNCNKYFVTKNFKINYCDRISPNHYKKTCKEVGRNNSFNIAKQNDKTLNYYHKVYSRKAMMKHRNPDIIQYEKAFNKYKETGKKKRERYIAGLLSEEDFIKWISENE